MHAGSWNFHLLMVCRLTITTEERYCFGVVIASSENSSSVLQSRKTPNNWNARSYQVRNWEEKTAALHHCVSWASAALVPSTPCWGTCRVPHKQGTTAQPGCHPKREGKGTVVSREEGPATYLIPGDISHDFSSAASDVPFSPTPGMCLLGGSTTHTASQPTWYGLALEEAASWHAGFPISGLLWHRDDSARPRLRLWLMYCNYLNRSAWTQRWSWQQLTPGLVSD